MIWEKNFLLSRWADLTEMYRFFLSNSIYFMISDNISPTGASSADLKFMFPERRNSNEDYLSLSA